MANTQMKPGMIVEGWMRGCWNKTKNTDNPRVEFYIHEIVAATKLTRVQVANALNVMRGSQKAEIVGSDPENPRTKLWALSDVMPETTKPLPPRNQLIEHYMREQYRKTKNTDNPKLEFTTGEIAEALKLSTQQVSNAMQKLMAMGRTEKVGSAADGKAYLYSHSEVLREWAESDGDKQKVMEESNVVAEIAEAPVIDEVRAGYIAEFNKRMKAEFESEEHDPEFLESFVKARELGFKPNYRSPLWDQVKSFWAQRPDVVQTDGTFADHKYNSEMSSGGNGGEINPDNQPGNEPKKEEVIPAQPSREPSRKQRKQLRHGTIEPSIVADLPSSHGDNAVLYSKFVRALEANKTDISKFTNVLEKGIQEVIKHSNRIDFFADNTHRAFHDSVVKMDALVEVLKVLNEGTKDFVEQQKEAREEFRQGFIAGWQTAVTTYNLTLPQVNEKHISIKNGEIQIDAMEGKEPTIYFTSDRALQGIPQWSMLAIVDYLENGLGLDALEILNFTNQLAEVEVQEFSDHKADIIMRLKTGASDTFTTSPFVWEQKIQRAKKG